MAAPNFDGDRGKNNLAHNNERQLIPFFLEDQEGNQVVNDNLVAAPGGQEKKGGKKKAQQQQPPPANIAAAKANKPTAVRPFAVGHKQSAVPVPAQTKAVAKGKQQAPAAGKWAGGAFLNSPPPSSLPMPRFIAGMTSSLPMDPAIISSSSNGAALRGGADATPHSARQGSRVLAKFTDGLWYEGTVMIRRGDDLDIVFDGYEHEGVYPVPAEDVSLLPLEAQPKDHQEQMQERQRQLDQQSIHAQRPPIVGNGQQQQMHPLPPRHPAQGMPPPKAPPQQTSLEDLEKRLLSTALDPAHLPPHTHMNHPSPILPHAHTHSQPSPMFLMSLNTPPQPPHDMHYNPPPIPPTQRVHQEPAPAHTLQAMQPPPQAAPNFVTPAILSAASRPDPSTASPPSPLVQGNAREIKMAPFPYADGGSQPASPPKPAPNQAFTPTKQPNEAFTPTKLPNQAFTPTKLPTRRPASSLLASAMSSKN